MDNIKGDLKRGREPCGWWRGITGCSGRTQRSRWREEGNKKARIGGSNRSARRCGTSGEAGHNAWTCKKDVKMTLVSIKTLSKTRQECSILWCCKVVVVLMWRLQRCGAHQFCTLIYIGIVARDTRRYNENYVVIVARTYRLSFIKCKISLSINVLMLISALKNDAR